MTPTLPPVPNQAQPDPDVPLTAAQRTALRTRTLARLARASRPKPEPDQLLWSDDERDCRICKSPTQWRTPRGSPTHPSCEHGLAPLTPAGEAGLLANLADVLGARPSVPSPGYRPLKLHAGRCGWCVGPTVGFRTVAIGGQHWPTTPDQRYHCREHMHFPYVWPED